MSHRKVRIIIYLCLWSCFLGGVSCTATANLPESKGEQADQIVSKPEKILPLKHFLLFPVDPEGLPPEVGSDLQSELAKAFQTRFGEVEGFHLKTLTSYPDMDRAHPRNKSFWINLSKEENVDACIYVRNEGYYQPDMVEQLNPDPLSFKGPQKPSANWRIILISGTTGEILWNNSWAATGSSKKFKLVAEVKDTFPELAEMAVQNWPIHPEQWNLKTGFMLGRQLPQEHYGEEHILFSGVFISEFIPTDMPRKIKVVFPQDVKKLTYVISLPTEKTRRIRVEWYSPDKKLIRNKKCSSELGPYIFDFLNLTKEAPGPHSGIWEIKVWEREVLLDHQLFQVGEVAPALSGGEPR